MPDRRPDFDRDWSHSGADYERYGRERGFRRQPERSSWREDRDERDTYRESGRYADYLERDERLYGEYPRDYSAASPPPYWMREENPRQGFSLPEPDRGRRGRFYGRGPKGYRRSDERIREEISDRLMANPDIDASEIELRVADAVVTLSGLVEDRHEKRIVEYVAEDVLGVDDVRNELKVRHGFLARLTGEHASDRELQREPSREVTEARVGRARPATTRGANAR